MSKQDSSYNQIVKATSLFGGVQVFSIVIGIIRSKVIAVLLGTEGVGLIGLFQGTLTIIQTITGFGLSSSAVRYISEANGTNDENRIAIVIQTVRRWVWFTGMLGASVTLSMAPLLSKWTFGSDKYTWSFVWLSIICLLLSISDGQNALLQGMRRLRLMAKSSLFGSTIGLMTALPLYYFFGVEGIVPSLIITAFCSLLLSFYFSRQVSTVKVVQTWKETYHSGIDMSKLGFVIMLNGFMLTFVSYLVNLYISNKGGVSDVGLYRAGWTISTQYTALIFAAMGTDFFPRLASINHDNQKLKEAVNQQSEIALLILGPMLIFLIGFAPLVVKLLYSADFSSIVGLIRWSLVGMLFKAASWALSFVIVAKGENRLMIIIETTSNIIVLGLNILGYTFWGITGIGISFAITYIAYFSLMFYVVNRKYSICYVDVFWKIFAIQSLLVIAIFVLSFLPSSLIVYVSTCVLGIISAYYSFVEMNNRIDLKEIIGKYTQKKQ